MKLNRILSVEEICLQLSFAIPICSLIQRANRCGRESKLTRVGPGFYMRKFLHRPDPLNKVGMNNNNCIQVLTEYLKTDYSLAECSLSKPLILKLSSTSNFDGSSQINRVQFYCSLEWYNWSFLNFSFCLTNVTYYLVRFFLLFWTLQTPPFSKPKPINQ